MRGNAHSDGQFYASEHAIVAKALGKNDQRFLTYVLDALNLNEVSEASAQPRLSVEKLRSIEILCPTSPDDQQAIAAALSDADGVVAGLERVIAKKRLINQSAMQDLITARRRLPGFSGEWEVKRLGDIAILRNGFAFSSLTYNYLGVYKVITIANVQDGRLHAENCNRLISLPSGIQKHQVLSFGDTLISMTGNVGRVCVVRVRTRSRVIART